VTDYDGLLDRSLEVFDGPPSLKEAKFSVDLKYEQRIEAAIEDLLVALSAKTEDDFCRGVASAAFSLDRVRHELLREGLKAKLTYETTTVPL
jgi:hypothetical protein